MPRFVILEHDHPQVHWDFMLESGDVLRTWRLATPPREGESVAAEAIGDHRMAYLDYEGPVSGNRGQVRRWDCGTFEWIGDEAERQELLMGGSRCSGRVVLSRVGARAWLLTWQRDTVQLDS